MNIKRFLSQIQIGGKKVSANYYLKNQWLHFVLLGIIYQLYPKSFNDSNADGVGDLKGITEKIDYFKQIGANIIYLNPIYKHGGRDNGYDVTSYTEIDSTFGTVKDFDLLIKKLHENGKIKIFYYYPLSFNFLFKICTL